MNTSRHSEVFDPRRFYTPIHIIGCGATGSHIALALCKLGIAHLVTIWDGDTVEEHNVPNQAFGHQHVGKNKAEAMRDMVLEYTGTRVGCVQPRFFKPGEGNLNGIVFLLVDSMDTRKAIWMKSIKYNPYVRYVIETRMGTDTGMVYSFSPRCPAEAKAWEDTLYSSARAQTSMCGVAQTLSGTAMLIAGYAVWRVIDYAKQSVVRDDEWEPSFCTTIATSFPEVIHNHHSKTK